MDGIAGQELEECRRELASCQEALRARQGIIEDLLTVLASSSSSSSSRYAAGPRPATEEPPLPSFATPPPMMVTSLFAPPGHHEPAEAKLEDLIREAEALGMALTINQFSELLPGQSLREHVASQQVLRHQTGTSPGPWILGTWTGAALKNGYGTPLALIAGQMWQSHLKNILTGDFAPYVIRLQLWKVPGVVGREESRFLGTCLIPIVIVDRNGRRFWGMVMQNWYLSPRHRQLMSMRDLQILNNSSISITVINTETGRVITQNLASMGLLGVHGSSHADSSWLHNGVVPSKPAPAVSVLLQVSTSGGVHVQIKPISVSCRMRGHVDGDENFLNLLFDYDKEAIEMVRQKAWAGIYHARLEIRNPTLRSMMGLGPEDELHHDVRVSTIVEPVINQKVFIISQVDVTEVVMARRHLQIAHDQLAEEKERTDVLLRRQHELIECLGKVGEETGRSADALLLDRVRVHIREGEGSVPEEVQLQELLGQGSYGKVYKGTWRGTVVAVKTMVFSNKMSGVEKKERMAIMEAAISSTLSHPNILQTYTYSLHSIKSSDKSSTSQSKSHQHLGHGEARSGGFEVQLVLEYCEYGSLLNLLEGGVLLDPDSGATNYLAVLELSADIAKGMLHLHRLNVLHSDLKPANVMLQSGNSNTCGLVAKVADFGLSVKMDRSETHISQVYHGTPTHMAPEILLEGHQSKAVDVYAFGITMWQLWTSDSPFRDKPAALLGHMVARENYRPTFPADTPIRYKALAEKCWCRLAADRPSFEAVLSELNVLLDEEIRCQRLDMEAAGEDARAVRSVRMALDSPLLKSRSARAAKPAPLEAADGIKAVSKSGFYFLSVDLNTTCGSPAPTAPLPQSPRLHAVGQSAATLDDGSGFSKLGAASAGKGVTPLVPFAPLAEFKASADEPQRSSLFKGCFGA